MVLDVIIKINLVNFIDQWAVFLQKSTNSQMHKYKHKHNFLCVCV